MSFANDNARGQPGVGKAVEAGNLGTHGTSRSIIEPLIATHHCFCRSGAICIFCIDWSRRIRSIERRRAESLRRAAGV